MSNTVLKTVNVAALARIADGGAVLGEGGGGGGDPYIGRLMAEHAMGDTTVPIVSIDDIDDDLLSLPITMMGAPQVMQRGWLYQRIVQARRPR